MTPRYEITLLVSAEAQIQEPLLLALHFEMSHFDDALLLDHPTPTSQFGVDMLLTASDQWEAMQTAETRVKTILRRLGISDCRVQIVRRQRIARVAPRGPDIRS